MNILVPVSIFPFNLVAKYDRLKAKWSASSIEMDVRAAVQWNIYASLSNSQQLVNNNNNNNCYDDNEKDMTTDFDLITFAEEEDENTGAKMESNSENQTHILCQMEDDTHQNESSRYQRLKSRHLSSSSSDLRQCDNSFSVVDRRQLGGVIWQRLRSSLSRVSTKSRQKICKCRFHMQAILAAIFNKTH